MGQHVGGQCVEFPTPTDAQHAGRAGTCVVTARHGVLNSQFMDQRGNTGVHAVPVFSTGETHMVVHRKSQCRHRSVAVERVQRACLYFICRHINGRFHVTC